MEVTYYHTKTKKTICRQEVNHVKNIFIIAKKIMLKNQLKSISFKYLQEDVTINETKESIKAKNPELCQKEN